MQAVSDATPMIHLAKIGKISLLKELIKKIFIPKEIFEETVIKGREMKKSEVVFIEDLIKEGFIVVKETLTNLNIPSLHMGELKAISLCKDLRIKNLFIDDGEGFNSARMLGLNPMRTTSLLLILLKKKSINFQEYKDSLLALSESGYFLDAETYEKLLDAGRKFNLE